MGRKPRQSVRRSPARKDGLIRRFSQKVGKNEMGLVLSETRDPRAQRLFEMLLDPAYRAYTLAKLCERAGVRMSDLMDWFRRFHLDVAVLNLVRRLPQIAEDTALDALAQERACSECNGKGTLAGEKGSGVNSCPWCEGCGKIRMPGDHQAQRLVFEVIGLIKKQGRSNRDRRIAAI